MGTHVDDPTPRYRAMALNPAIKPPSKLAIASWDALLAARAMREEWGPEDAPSRQVRRWRKRRGMAE